MFKPINGVRSVTTNVAEAAAPLPPSVEVTTLVVLVFVPEVVPVTLVLKEQLALLVREMPVIVSRFPPVMTRLLPIPHTLLVVPFVAVSPGGKVSVNPMPLNEVKLFGFVIVKDNVELLPVDIELGLNDFDNVGGAITFSVSSA